ncbi:hypothetical protein ACOMHN_032632 [Nucella lapillus]
MDCLPSQVLRIFLFYLACIVGGTVAACENTYNNTYCGSTLAVADFCRLEVGIRCNCAKDCQARPHCPGVGGDNDQLCDCPFSSFDCANSAKAWYRSFCPYSCGLRDSVTCQPLMEITGASPLINGQPPGNATPGYMDAVTWQCHPGWHQTAGPASHSHKRVCTADGSWLLHPQYQSPGLVCARDSCGPVPTAPALTTPTRSSGVFEDTVKYTCPVGYTNTGAAQGTHRCNESAIWERLQPDPLCTVVQCGASPAVTNAISSASSGFYLTVITYGCLQGYVKTGPGTGHKVCNATGHWAPVEGITDLVCTGRSCGVPPFVIGATPSSPIGRFPEHVTYTCKAGYVLIGGGTGQTKCMADGSWSANATDPVPLCLAQSTLFVNSESEIHNPSPTASWTSVSAQSKLHCASFCAASVRCHGFNFSVISRDCSMNTGSRLPVISTMKKLYQ